MVLSRITSLGARHSVRSWPAAGASSSVRHTHRATAQLTIDRHRASAYEALGLDSELAANERDVRNGFLREIRKLSRKDRTGRRTADNATAEARSHGTDVGSQAKGMVKAHESAKLAERRDRVVKAFRTLRSDAGARSRYSATAVPSTDSTLNLVKTESPFANFDPRRQQFVFADPGDRPMDDTSRAREALHGYDPSTAAATSSSEAPTSGENVDIRLAVSFADAFTGCTKSVTFTRRGACVQCDGSGNARKSSRRCTSCKGRGQLQLPSANHVIKRDCASCNGTGRRPPPLCRACFGSGLVSQEATVPVAIEPGTLDGTTIRVTGQGDFGRRGGERGDLVVSCMVGAHRLLHRVQDDFHVALPVPLSVALLGGRVSVPTAEGDTTEAVVPPGSTSGTILSLPGLGAPRTGKGAGTFGGLRVHLVVVVPHVEELTKQQRSSILLLQEEDAEDGLFGGGGGADANRIDSSILAAAKDHFKHWLPSRDQPSSTGD